MQLLKLQLEKALAGYLANAKPAKFSLSRIFSQIKYPANKTVLTLAHSKSETFINETREKVKYYNDANL